MYYFLTYAELASSTIRTSPFCKPNFLRLSSSEPTIGCGGKPGKYKKMHIYINLLIENAHLLKQLT